MNCVSQRLVIGRYYTVGQVTAVEDLDQFNRELVHEPHRILFGYWKGKALDRLPARRDIDPLDIPAVLPTITMTDVVREGGGHRFRRRLVGTAIAETFGRDNTGCWVDELYEEPALSDLLRAYDWVIEHCQPRFDHCSLPLAERSYISYDRLTLPLAEDGQTVDVLLQSLVFTDD